jgi:hypothetical protein
VGGALPGGQKVIAAGDMDIYGGGADIWQSRDQFRFIWREVDGEFELTATLAALAMSHEYAKAGLMIRTGNQPEAAFVMIHVFPGGGISLAHRSAAGQPVEEKLLDTSSFQSGWRSAASAVPSRWRTHPPKANGTRSGSASPTPSARAYWRPGGAQP